ncbi:putative autophagy-related protein 11 [Onthophagus taurus]|uniref:putative autophagy-related protein 11 n=1 Tax=Onthophagus taurus TaxID=166361 RepID=UPI0039BDB1F6
MARTKKNSSEEIRKKKRECEKRRREKIKNNPERKEIEQIKKHELYKNAKKKGIVKSIKDLSNREKRVQRKKWKENSKRYREKRQALKNLRKNTPPTSSDTGTSDELDEDNSQVEAININVENNGNGSSCSFNNNSISTKLGTTITKENRNALSRQKTQGRKVMLRNRAKCYRTLGKVRKENSNLKRQLDMYKKKYYRLKNKSKTEKDTPNSNVNKLLKGVKNVPQEVKKHLLFGEVIKQELTNNFQALTDCKRKQAFAKVIKGKMLKKYRLLKFARSFLPYSLWKKQLHSDDILCYNRKNRQKIPELRKLVGKFFIADENSRLAPGKKDTITRNLRKKQKRYLNATMKTLHKQFKKQHDISISYSTFCKLRPFWVVPQKLAERNTCLCVLHENMNLLIQALWRVNILKESSTQNVLCTMCCDIRKETCLNRICQSCNTNKLLFNVHPEKWNMSYPYQQWTTKKEERVSEKTKKTILVQRTLKQKMHAKPHEIITKLNILLPKFINHSLNILHQFNEINELKRNLQEHELLLHIDFSENYCYKYPEEA